MKGAEKKDNDSNNEIIIYKPTPKRLCPSKKKNNSASSRLVSSTSSIDESKMLLTNFDNISLQEIDNDFLMLEQNFEEQQCQDELLNIINNSSDNNSLDSNIQTTQKIKRCKKPFEENNYEFLKEIDMRTLFNELNISYTHIE